MANSSLAAGLAVGAVILGTLGGALTGYLTGKKAADSVSPPTVSTATTNHTGDVTEVSRRVLPSTVQIIVTTARGSATGTGFVIDDKGNIATNNHVIAPAAADSTARLEIRTSNGLFTTARIVGRSPSYDLAVIKADGLRAPAVVLGDSDKAVTGQPVIAIGAPLRLAGTVTTGIISAEDRPVVVGASSNSVAFINAIQTDAAINPGNSGGPLVDMEGKVIGINSAGRGIRPGEVSGSIGLGFAIPINEAKRLINQILTEGRATFPVLGAYPDPEYERGARVQSVSEGSPAAKAGIRIGDTISQIAGKRVLSPAQMMVMIREHEPDTSISMVITRGGKDYPLSVKLGSQVG